MAEKIRYEVDVDSSDAKRGLSDFSRAAKKAGKDAASALDDTATAGDKARAAIKQMADTMDTELRASAKAAQALGDALGPELAGRVDTDKLVADLNRMGVSFTEIEGDADKFAATLREVDGIRLQQVNDGLGQTGDHMRTAGGETDKLSDSARGAHSALANMIGNSAQDLGAMGGVAGSAGVAIGQMAEYASDAALAGEGLGSSLASMAAVAGPIAALSAAMLALKGIMALIHRDDGLTAAQVAAVSKALADQIGVLDDYQSAVSSAFGQGTADTIEVFTEAVFKAFDATKGADFVTGLETALGRLGVVRRQFGEIAAQSQQDQAAWLADLLNLHGVVPSVAADVADYYAGLSQGNQATVDWARNNPDLAASFLTVSTALGEARRDNNAATQDFLDNQASINEGTRALVQAAIATAAAQADATGAQFTWNDALQAYIALQQQVLQIGGAVAAVQEQQTQAAADTQQALEDQTTAIADGIQAWKDHTTAVREAAIALAGIHIDSGQIAAGFQAALDAVDDGIGHLKFAEDLQHQFDDALKDARKFGPDLRELLDLQAAGVTITPDITLGNLESDDAEFLAWVQSLQQMVKGGAVEAFTTGGTDAANAFVQAQAAAFLAANPQLTLADFYNLMGLPPDGNIGVIVSPIIATEKLNAIQPIIDNLVSSGVLSPEIALQISALNIDDPEAALALAVQTLEAAGLEVPVQLMPDTAGFQQQMDGVTTTPWGTTVDISSNADDTKDDIDTATEDRTTEVFVPKSDSLGQMQTLIDYVARDRTVKFISKADNAGAIDAILDAVALPTEDGRLAYMFAIVNPGSRATADNELDNIAMPGGVARTAYINVVASGGGGGGVSVPNTGGQSVGAPTGLSAPAATVHSPSAVTMASAPAGFTANVTINTGVLGNHFDVERTVSRSLRRFQRINGRR